MAADVPGGDLPAAYVALCLRLRRLVPALVALVAVDPVVRWTVGNEPVATAAELVRQAGRLAAAVPDAGLPPARERFLVAHLSALEWRARGLAGQRVPFRREVRECLGLSATPGDPDAYRAAHRELAAMLGGRGTVGERLAAHRRRDAVPRERLGPAVHAMSTALRRRVASRYGLPPAEAVACRLVDDAPWTALHTYAGGHRSVVQVNVGAVLGAARLPRLVAHEAYPGHHVECIRAEAAVAAGRVEQGITLLGSPQTVVSEGLAECALGSAVGPRWGRWASDVLAAVAVPLDGELAERLDLVLTVLRRVRLDAALLLHDDGPPTSGRVAAAEAYVRRWLLLDAGRARRVVEALARPLWRANVVASVEGAEIVRTWLDRGSEPVARHRRLLAEPSALDALRIQMSTQRGNRIDRR